MSSGGFAELSVLVVDDNEHMRRLLRGILQALGVNEFREADNGMTAINECKLFIPDAIIIDLEMEPIDGLEFTRLLREDVSHPSTCVPVLMSTGHAEKAVVESARDVGVTEFLAKPVTVDGVGARLHSLIEKPRRFIRSSTFSGPDRRRRALPVQLEKRGRELETPALIPAPTEVGATPEKETASGPKPWTPPRRALR
jgi:two-component system chemotaxis response regulator CheY